ncbi:MAG: hypothetical protein QNJ69_02550 [Gammaproteobacteria bacterium]|nr:hypothetical protein [Gammaproteobacteria bacterium]
MEVKSWAMMGFDGLALLLPQASVSTIELVQSVQPVIEVHGSLGTITTGGKGWPVFSLDRQLKPLSGLADEHKFIACLSDADDPVFALACEVVTTISDIEPDAFKSIQDCMRIASCPVEAVLYRDNQLMMVSSLPAMKQLLLMELH